MRYNRDINLKEREKFMEYKKLSELSKSELQKILKENRDFESAVYESAYEDAMRGQEIEFEEMGAQVFEYSDHYSSFYLSTPRVCGGKAPEKVAGALDADYMTPENSELYKKLCDKMNQWENMTIDEQDKNGNIYDEACELCDELADGITKQLRAYEDITDEQVAQVIEDIADGNSYMSDWTTNGAQVFEHITKIYK